MKSGRLIFKTKTRYADYSIVGRGNCIELRSGVDALQSVINTDKPHKLELKNLEYLLGVLLFLPIPQNILLLGTGGGSLIHFLKFHYPQCQLTTVDYDSDLVELLHQKMLLPEADANLNYQIDDAAHYIQCCKQNFDLILVDIFSASQSPDWLLESPNIQQIQSLLSDQGAVAYNLLIDSEHAWRLFNRDLRRIFDQRILALAVKGIDNSLAYGFCYQALQQDMSYYLQHASDMSVIHNINYNEVLAAIYNSNPIGESGII